MFSDEKKLNLDGPDGVAYYWHDLQKEQIFSKCQQGGGSLMVWAGFGNGGKTNLAFPTGRMKAHDYLYLLDTHLLPFAEAIQQYSATIHVTNSTWKWFLQNGVYVMDWPEHFPDLIPMENLWVILCRSVRADDIEYTNITELKAAIISSLENIEVSRLQKNVSSMCDRSSEIVLKQCSFTGY